MPKALASDLRGKWRQVVGFEEGTVVRTRSGIWSRSRHVGLVLILIVGACSNSSPRADGSTEDTAEHRSNGSLDDRVVDRRAAFEASTWASIGGPEADSTSTPTSMEFLPSGEALVATKGGFSGPQPAFVHLLAPDGTVVRRVLELPVCSDAERGFIGMAVDPLFATRSYLYVYYTRQMADCHISNTPANTRNELRVFNRVSRFEYRNDRFDPASEHVLLDGIPAFQSSHNGGGLEFGEDRSLYVGVGEASLSDRSPDPNSPVGKILQLDPDEAVPISELNAGSARFEPEMVWASGLRNPFRFGVDSASDRLFVGDVGDMQYEELNIVVEGGDYGWPSTEGPFSKDEWPDLVPPVLWYDRQEGCLSIIGGPVVPPSSAIEELAAHAVFSDFGCGKVWAVDISAPTPENVVLFADLEAQVTHVELGPDGSLFVLSAAPLPGEIFRIRPR